MCSLQKRVSWTVCLSCHQLNNEEYIGYERQYINNCLKDKCKINWQGQIILLIFLWLREICRCLCIWLLVLSPWYPWVQHAWNLILKQCCWDESFHWLWPLFFFIPPSPLACTNTYTFHLNFNPRSTVLRFIILWLNCLFVKAGIKFYPHSVVRLQNVCETHFRH